MEDYEYYEICDKVKNTPLSLKSISNMQDYLLYQLREEKSILEHIKEKTVTDCYTQYDRVMLQQLKIQKIEKALSLRTELDDEIITWSKAQAEKKSKEEE